MSAVHYRQAGKSDIALMAHARAQGSWEGGASEERMSLYLEGLHHPQHALMPRVIYVAMAGDSLVGYIAGHLTRRYACDGELQWIYVVPEYRRSGVASELLRLLTGWFAQRNASRICVDVDPADTTARRFYAHTALLN